MYLCQQLSLQFFFSPERIKCVGLPLDIIITKYICWMLLDIFSHTKIKLELWYLWSTWHPNQSKIMMLVITYFCFLGKRFLKSRLSTYELIETIAWIVILRWLSQTLAWQGNFEITISTKSLPEGAILLTIMSWSHGLWTCYVLARKQFNDGGISLNSFHITTVS